MTDEDAIRDWFDRYVANNNAGDFDAYGDFWAKDAIWLPPDSPVIRGREALLEYARPFFEQYKMHQEVTVEEIKVVDSFAFARSNFSEKYTPKAEGDSIELSTKEIFIFQRQDDGTWVSTHCIWNSNTSPSHQV
jgi:uncharacterized protein (TIGR02246 family)